jgi:hypothetical protein
MKGFHPEFLVENGAATGSRVIPTPTGFMKDEIAPMRFHAAACGSAPTRRHGSAQRAAVSAKLRRTNKIENQRKSEMKWM